MAEREVRRYIDAYRQEAVAIKDEFGNGWKVTFNRGQNSYTRKCRSIQQVRRVLDANGYGWAEVDRWMATTLMA
jgi:hypothetical protein